MTNDVEHLRLLSLFHYVVGGLAALFSLFPLIHLFMGVAIVTGGPDEGSSEPAARLVGWFFILLASAMIAAGLAFATSMVLAGRFLARHVYYTFCLVMAALECIFVPLGTVLGIFTILALQRPTVKEMFGQTAPSQRASS